MKSQCKLNNEIYQSGNAQIFVKKYFSSKYVLSINISTFSIYFLYLKLHNCSMITFIENLEISNSY
jgi:hypothetical protein